MSAASDEQQENVYAFVRIVRAGVMLLDIGERFANDDGDDDSDEDGDDGGADGGSTLTDDDDDDDGDEDDDDGVSVITATFEGDSGSTSGDQDDDSRDDCGGRSGSGVLRALLRRRCAVFLHRYAAACAAHTSAGSVARMRSSSRALAPPFRANASSMARISSADAERTASASVQSMAGL